MVAEFAGLNLSVPIVMGILNVTPDSFSDGGDLSNIDIIQRRAEEFCRAGAKILDIGGESTRPGASAPSIEDEINRVVPAIAAVHEIANQYGVKISIDTRRQPVMQAAVESGADIINDVSALETDAAALPFIAAQQLPVILCHMQGTPADMQHQPHYENVVQEIYDYFTARIAVCET
ncbi:MAG TPA: dihydropteroate synthase, partial [Alphaproteobacteria bacterium]|nr:dihydropteroate synthase [Alphaproteobacteria bacterium]